MSSPDHGFMKPNPSIFRAALALLDVEPEGAVMVGDSVAQDVNGALGIGMRAVLLHRADNPHPQTSELEAVASPSFGRCANCRRCWRGPDGSRTANRIYPLMRYGVRPASRYSISAISSGVKLY
jgi:hypothetical protein